jgi:hypothetical protein
VRVYHRREMPENLKKFEAALAEWEGLECSLVTIAFGVEDENDALEVAEDIALPGRK